VPGEHVVQFALSILGWSAVVPDDGEIKLPSIADSTKLMKYNFILYWQSVDKKIYQLLATWNAVVESHVGVGVAIHPNPSLDRCLKIKIFVYCNRKFYTHTKPVPHVIQSNEPPPWFTP
jgi:hypothetical protein